MSTMAVSGPSDVATLDYQENYMEYVYNQDCGSYTVTMTPNLGLLTLRQTGATGGSNGHTFYDEVTLASTSLSDVG